MEGGTCVLRDTGPRGETEAGLESLQPQPACILHAAPWPWHKTLPAHPNTAGPLLPCRISSALNVGPWQNLSLPARARALEREQRRRHIVGDTLCVCGGGLGVTNQQAGLLADPPGSVVQPGGIGTPVPIGRLRGWGPPLSAPCWPLVPDTGHGGSPRRLQLLQTPKNPADTPNSGNPAAS